MTNKGSCMLTTVDNPYNPFEQFVEWYMYDVENGHNSASQVAMFAHPSDQLSDDENLEEIERAIDDIIANDWENKFIKVYIDNKELVNANIAN